MKDKVDILGVFINNITMDKAVEKVNDFILEDKTHIIYTPNSEILFLASKDEDFKKILNESDLLVADGAGVVLASKILGNPLPERIAGFDLVQNIFKTNYTKRVFLVGGSDGIAVKAGEKISERFPNVRIVGSFHGYFNEGEQEQLIENINNLNVDVLLVGIGAPKQEKWIYSNKDKLKVHVCIGVGGCFDVFAGNIKRAPLFFQNNGLEWFYRLCIEPWRIKRILKIPQFIFKVIVSKFKKY